MRTQPAPSLKSLEAIRLPLHRRGVWLSSRLEDKTLARMHVRGAFVFKSEPASCCDA